MDKSSSDGVSKRNSRHGSSGRATIARRPTRGPLDVADSPLSPSPLSQTSASSPTSTPPPSSTVPPLISNTSSLVSPTASQYNTPSLPADLSKLTLSTDPSFRTARTSSPAPPAPVTQKDFSYLLNPSIYHPLSHLDIPPPFRTLSTQPSSTSSLSTLISKGQFRGAAILAATALTASGANAISPYDHVQIFSLIYTRLSCLTLCNQTTLAAQEVKALEDLNSAFYREGDDGTGAHLVPWELRVLAVRLQGMGFNDVRRGIMGFYDLAKDVRTTLSVLKKELVISEEEEETQAKSGEIAIWEHRLADLGIRVASALIEMEDFEGAAAFLSTLTPNSSSKTVSQQGVVSDGFAIRKALLYLTLGQVDVARACVSSSQKEDAKVILALAYMADANYDPAVVAWQELIDGGDEENMALYKQNLAVVLLYQGKMTEARLLLEDLIDQGSSFHALTFNLSTIYELCTEKSRVLKIGLAEKVAGMLEEELERDDVNGIGEGKVRRWEKINGDFKL